MKFLDSFKKLFSKKESEGTEEKRQQIERSLNAKILADMEKEKAKKRLTIEDFDRFNQQEKDMRKLIEKKRKEQKKEDMAKKRNKTLSANF
tara:strand:+ start:581 stop:853 length:273 start_codon:yes stop_codon:yes gene_type:complete